jgi:DNA-binding response OmpR family regulator
MSTKSRPSEKGRPDAKLPLNPPRILLAEDDKEMRKLLSWTLKVSGYDVVECAHGMQLLHHLSEYLEHDETYTSFDLIVSDIRMPGVTGLEVLEGLHDSTGFPPMIMITAFGDEETHAYARKLGVADFFDKPFPIEEFLAKVREIAPLNPDAA